MADPLQLLERDYRETAGALDLADHNRTWANTFTSTPKTEVLRANRNYDDLISTAIDQRMKLGALTDPKQQKMYYESRLQPLKEEVLRGEIAHKAAATVALGAAQRYKQRQDMNAMEDQVNFLHHMENAPPPGTPEHEKHVLLGVDKFPHILTTEFGKDLLTNISKGHDTIAQLRAQLPEGFKMKKVVVGGGKQNAVTGEPDEMHIPADARKTLAELNARKASKAHWLTREKDPVKREHLQAQITDADLQIQAWNETYNPQPKTESKALATPTEATSSEIKSQSEYDALPAGSDFIFQGKRGKKPAAK